MFAFTYILFVSCLVIICTAISLPNPLHASCKLDWSVGMECGAAADKLIKQINAWKGDDCGTSEKCLYSLEHFDGTTLLAKHETPKKHYVDNLKMVFTPNGTNCAIHGESSSELWYAILDYGTNYCNLHNLVTGSGLSQTKDFSEKTNDWKCTQYSSANCDKY